MACLIKAPSPSSKGVLTLTTQERDRLVYGFDDIRCLLIQVKQRYVVGLHHNWHDYALKYDPLFDFHLAGDEDLREVSGKRIPLLPMDACNFAPDFFRPSASGEKFWDVLFVARAVEFKGIPEFFAAIKRLFDMGHRLRVLFICPVPEQGGTGSLRNVRELYDAMFVDGEQDLFTLLTTNFRYPFPFDLSTLSHFYRASRVFAHSAPDERRCRVAAYAWATGLPVVGMAPVGSVLTPALRRNPYFYEIASYADLPQQILRALEMAQKQPDFAEVQAEIASNQSVRLFEQHLNRLFNDMNMPAPVSGGWMHGLDIRMGRHHGLPAGTNRLDQDIATFLEFLCTAKPSAVSELAECEDPEIELARRLPSAPRAIAEPRVSVAERLKRVLGALRRSIVGARA
jgi:glycosyltransferase involved in cell wall biosynthesis